MPEWPRGVRGETEVEEKEVRKVQKEASGELTKYAKSGACARAGVPPFVSAVQARSDIKEGR